MSTKLFNMAGWHKRGFEIKNCPYIGEVDADVDLGIVLKIGDDYYVPGLIAANKGYAGVEQIDFNTEPEDRDCENEMTCPYCGYKDIDSWELQDSDDEHECGRCGATISYERIVTVEYSSSPVRPPEIVEAEFVG